MNLTFQKIVFTSCFFAVMSTGFAQQKDLQNLINKTVAENAAEVEKTYKFLHQNPEVSFKEEKTAKFLAQKARELGYEVTENFGGTGVVAVLKNGEGKTLMIRADMDGLPVKEETNLDYASQVITIDSEGVSVPAMHACGHDIHMSVWYGTAYTMAKLKNQWKGTLILVGQPAEEKGGGAKAMLAEGLYQKFPKPDYCLALHTSADLPAGKVGLTEGYALASVDAIDITVYGKGGHGAYPHTTIDPIVLASRMVLDFQTIASREIAPVEPIVLTVGSIHGGTKHNIIPNEVKLQLTLRAYSDEVRNHAIAAIKRIGNGLAASAGLPQDKYPTVYINNESIPSLYNTPSFTQKMKDVFSNAIGKENVISTQAVMGGEDFGLFGRTPDTIPLLIYWLGTVNPENYTKAQKGEIKLPSLHSSTFAPVINPSLSVGIQTMCAGAFDILKK